MKIRQKTLAELFKGLNTPLPQKLTNLKVSGVQYNSRKIRKGDLFVAIRGFKTDGHVFLPDVQRAGALAAVVQQENPALTLPQISVSDSREALAWLAANFHRPEIDSLELTAITGTNGKTTTAFLVHSILDAAALAGGLIGTVAYYYGTKKVPAWNTTPEAPEICQILAELAKQKQKTCVLEVSSHALSLKRVDGLRFKTAVFTNLSRDHLDFYKTERAYFSAKSRLFTLLKQDGKAVINIDDPFGRRLLKQIKQPVITFGFSKDALVRPLDWQTTSEGSNLILQTIRGKIKIRTYLIGEYNVENIMAAVAASQALGIKNSAITAGIRNMKRVPGRLEAYPLANNILAIIDYAHTPDALQKALKTLKKLSNGRLVVLFGAGGDRDHGKRPLMGKVAEEYADFVIVTSDNPRSEDPDKIIEDILSGMVQPQKRKVIGNRREAIRFAVQNAKKDDIILIAGKGHETYQEINGVKHDFNEVQILKDAAGNV